MEKAIYAVGGLLVTALGFFLKDFFSTTKDKASSTSKELTEFKLAAVTAVNGMKAELDKANTIFKHEMEKLTLVLNTKIDNLASTVATYSKDVSKVEGAVEGHMKLLSDHISTNRAVSDKLTRVFEYIDAKERATDLAKKGDKV